MHYCQAIDSPNGYRARVYHYDASGNRQLIDYLGNETDQYSSAIDEASSWADDRDLEYEMDWSTGAN